MKEEIEALAEKYAEEKHLIKGYTGTYDLETSLQLSAQIESSKQDFAAGYSAANEWVKVESWEDIPKGDWQFYLEKEMLGVRVQCGRNNKFITVGSNFAWDAPKITHYRPLPTPPTT